LETLSVALGGSPNASTPEESSGRDPSHQEKVYADDSRQEKYAE
jgi:hypothetical protein